MPFTSINVVNGSTPMNATWGNNAQTQYTEATNSFEQDLFSAGFVYSGLVCTKDGSIVNQLDVTAGVAFLLQADNTLRRRAPAASTPGQFTTATPSTTYFLDLNQDGSWSWATSHSGASHLTICSATTDGSGNILAVTDARITSALLLNNMVGKLGLPNLRSVGSIVAATASQGVPVIVAQAALQVVTVTTQVTLVTFSVPTNGLYRVTFGLSLNGTNASNIPRFRVTWTDPVGSNTASPVGQSTAGTPAWALLDGTSTYAAHWASVPIMPISMVANVGTMTITYQNNAATPSDTVSVMVERLV